MGSRPPPAELDVRQGQGWASPGSLGQEQRQPLSLGRAFLPVPRGLAPIVA